MCQTLLGAAITAHVAELAMSDEERNRLCTATPYPEVPWHFVAVARVAPGAGQRQAAGSSGDCGGHRVGAPPVGMIDQRSPPRGVRLQAD